MSNHFKKFFLSFLFLFISSSIYTMDTYKRSHNDSLHKTLENAQQNNFSPNSVAQIKSFIEKGANVNDNNAEKDRPLSIAMNNNYIGTFETLLQYININSKIQFPADPKYSRYATKSHNTNEYIFNCTPLIYAVCTSNEPLTKYLLNRKANVNYDTNRKEGTPLFIALENNNEQILENLLIHRANINQRGINGRTPLVLVASLAKENLIDLLLKHNADANAKDYNGNTPLHIILSQLKGILWYAERRELDQKEIEKQEQEEIKIWRIVEQLLKHRANPNVKLSLGHSPLALAFACGHTNMVKFLLKYRAGIDYKDNNDSTALAYTFDKYDPLNRYKKNQETIAIIKKLCAAGASPIDINKFSYGKSIFHMALDKNCAIKDFQKLMVYASKYQKKYRNIEKTIWTAFLAFNRLDTDKACKLPYLPRDIQFKILFELPLKYHFSVDRLLYKTLSANGYKNHYSPKLLEQVNKQVANLNEMLQSAYEKSIGEYHSIERKRYLEKIKKLYDKTQHDLKVFNAAFPANITTIPADNVALQIYQDLV